MREIDDPQHAKDQREPDRHQAIEQACDESVDGKIGRECAG